MLGWQAQMSDFRTFHGGEPRPPTWAERERINALREEGVEDVYVEPEAAPQEFWQALMETIDYFLAPSKAFSTTWEAWRREIAYATGLSFRLDPQATFEAIVRDGVVATDQLSYPATVGVRFAAIEHLIDVARPDNEFAERVNDRARWFRVGVRIEDGRFIPITSEHLHTEIVRPALLLLSQESFAEIDGLYRKAFDRVLSGDASGAITASISAVEQMFRVLMPSMAGQSLSPLAEKARADGIIAPAVEEFVKKLYALRPDSDAHAGGTSDFDLAMLAIHLAGSILLYLSKTSS
jgi:hypothetical protein